MLNGNLAYIFGAKQDSTVVVETSYEIDKYFTSKGVDTQLEVSDYLEHYFREHEVAGKIGAQCYKNLGVENKPYTNDRTFVDKGYFRVWDQFKFATDLGLDLVQL